MVFVVMAPETYREAFRKAQADYNALQERRENLLTELAAIDVDMANLRRGVIALAAICGEHVDEMNLGLTESIRTLFRQSTTQLTTHEVREGIEALGFDLSTQKNPAASIQAVLTRLADSNEITRKVEQERQPNGTIKAKVYWAPTKMKARTPVTNAPAPPNLR